MQRKNGNSSSRRRKSILLIYPGPKTSLPRFPMSVIVLGSYLRKNGYNVRILDTRIEDYENMDLGSVLCVGISSMSGVQLEHAVKIARYIKEEKSEIPIIWGGVHPSFFPAQAIKSRYIDVVVRGEGEETLLELVQKIERNESIENVKGITYIQDGKVVDNPDRGFMELDKLELPAYDLLELEKYADLTDGFSYESSRGCPHRCKFCYNLYFHKRKWRGKNSKKVLDELESIVRRYKVKKIYFVEDELFANRSRAKEIFEGICRRDLGIEWSAFCRADFISRRTDSEIKLLKDSGCEILSIGVESGSPEMLRKINKDITVEQVEDAVRKCVKCDIMPVMSFIIGIPGETKEDMFKTLRFYDKLMKTSEKIEINGCFVYTPYPGTPIFEIAIQKGYKPKESLEEWGQWKYSDVANTPWLTTREKNELDIISTIARFRYFVHRLEFYSERYKHKKIGTFLTMVLYRLSLPFFRFSANYRWKNHFFQYAFEWKMWIYIIEHKFRIR